MRKQKASETRFLLIFDRFGGHLGPPKRTQNRLKMASKKRCKNEGLQDGLRSPLGAVLGPNMARRLCRRPADVGLARAWRGLGAGVRALALELRSREFRESEGPPKRASAAGSAGPRPDLSPSGCGPRPFADSVSKKTERGHPKSIKNQLKIHQK